MDAEGHVPSLSVRLFHPSGLSVVVLSPSLSRSLPSCSGSLRCLRVTRPDFYMKRLLFIHLRDSHCVSSALRRLYHFSCRGFSNLFISSHAQTSTLHSVKSGESGSPRGVRRADTADPHSLHGVLECVCLKGK